MLSDYELQVSAGQLSSAHRPRPTSACEETCLYISTILFVIYNPRSPLFALDLRCHLLQTRSQRFDLRLLARNSRFQFLDFTMLFEKLVQQHRVHGIVANSLEFAVAVAFDQIRAYLFDFLCNESKAKRTRAFNLRLVAKAHWPETVNGFAGLFHGSDFILETARRYLGTEFTVGINVNRLGPARLIPDIPDVTAVARVLTADAVADTDNVIGRGDTVASFIAQGRVMVAAGVVGQRGTTTGRVVTPGGVTEKGQTTRSRIAASGGVRTQCFKTVGRVVASFGVAKKRIKTDGRVAVAGRIAKECERSIGGVADANSVAESAPAPVAVFSFAVLLKSVPAPTPVQKLPSVILKSEYIPTAVLYRPALVSKFARARCPSAVLPPG